MYLFCFKLVSSITQSKMLESILALFKYTHPLAAAPNPIIVLFLFFNFNNKSLDAFIC